MTYPTIAEMDQMRDSGPLERAAQEFIWAFTEWWESVGEREYEVPLDTPLFKDVEHAYEHWRSLR